MSNKIALIIKREYLSRVTKKSFIVMTILGPLLIAGFMSLAFYLGMSNSVTYKVAVSAGDAQRLDFIKQRMSFKDKQAASFNVEFEMVPEFIPNGKLKDTDYNVHINLDPELLINGPIKRNESVVLQAFFTENISDNALAYINSQITLNFERMKIEQLNLAKESNITREDLDNLKVNLSLQKVDDEKNEVDHSSTNAYVGFFFAILIYTFIFMYGVQVMRGVIEEKTNRIVEIIVSSVTPFQLMMGKIVGIAMVGLTQFILWVVLTFTAVTTIQVALLPSFADVDISSMNSSTQLAEGADDMLKNEFKEVAELKANVEANEFMVTLKSINYVQYLLLFVFYFLGGYFFYAALFAAVGSAVDAESDTQQFMLPITLPLVFGFIIAQLTIVNPTGSASVWASILPFTSPVVMMVRVAFDMPIWQLLLSMFFLVLGFVITTWIASKIYRVGILMYGKKASWKELFKWLKY